MFVHQAEAQFKLFAGVDAPAGLFAGKVAAALGSGD
jgi:shikimate 5-dehydrogenase